MKDSGENILNQEGYDHEQEHKLSDTINKKEFVPSSLTIIQTNAVESMSDDMKLQNLEIQYSMQL